MDAAQMKHPNDTQIHFSVNPISLFYSINFWGIQSQRLVQNHRRTVKVRMENSGILRCGSLTFSLFSESMTQTSSYGGQVLCLSKTFQYSLFLCDMMNESGLAKYEARKPLSRVPGHGRPLHKHLYSQLVEFCFLHFKYGCDPSHTQR